MSKPFIFKGEECVRKLICFSTDTTSHEIDRDAPIFGVNDLDPTEESLRQLNAEIRPNLIGELVKFWTALPEVKFRFLVMSFQRYLGSNAQKFTEDEEFRKSVLSLFIALFQQILVECAPRIIKKIPLATILKVSQIQNSSALAQALRKFDLPYQKSLISQDSMGYVNKSISEASSKEYKNVVEELVNLLTIKIK